MSNSRKDGGRSGGHHRSKCAICQNKPKPSWMKYKLMERYDKQVEETILDLHDSDEWSYFELYWDNYDEGWEYWMAYKERMDAEEIEDAGKFRFAQSEYE